VATPLSGREDVSEMQIAAVGGPEASEETREVEAKAGLPMGEVFRFPDPPPPPPPKNVLRAVLFTVMERSIRPLTCAPYDVETGLSFACRTVMTSCGVSYSVGLMLKNEPPKPPMHGD